MEEGQESLSERFRGRCTPDQKRRWERAANKTRRALSDWIRLTLDDAAERELKSGKSTIDLSEFASLADLEWNPEDIAEAQRQQLEMLEKLEARRQEIMHDVKKLQRAIKDHVQSTTTPATKANKHKRS